MSTRQLTILTVFLLMPVGAFFIADLANQFVAHALQVSPPLKVSYPSGRSIQTSHTSDASSLLSEIISGPLFPRAAEKPAPSQSSASFQEDTLDLRLMGTMAGEGHLSPAAVIQEGMERRQRLYKLGDLVAGRARLIRIGSQRVVLRDIQTSNLIKLTLYGGEPADLTRGAAKKVSVSKSGSNGAANRRLVLDRREIKEKLSNLPQLMTRAQMAPAYNNGVLQGYMLIAIAPGSFFEKLGLRKHDILTRINGMEIKDPARLAQVMGQLKYENTIALDMIRTGKPLTMEYFIR